MIKNNLTQISEESILRTTVVNCTDKLYPDNFCDQIHLWVKVPPNVKGKNIVDGVKEFILDGSVFHNAFIDQSMYKSKTIDLGKYKITPASDYIILELDERGDIIDGEEVPENHYSICFKRYSVMYKAFMSAMLACDLSLSAHFNGIKADTRAIWLTLLSAKDIDVGEVTFSA